MLEMDEVAPGDGVDLVLRDSPYDVSPGLGRSGVDHDKLTSREMAEIAIV